MNDQEDQMRAIDCPCGHHFEAAGDEELFRLCREHVDADHPTGTNVCLPSETFAWLERRRAPRDPITT